MTVKSRYAAGWIRSKALPVDAKAPFCCHMPDVLRHAGAAARRLATGANQFITYAPPIHDAVPHGGEGHDAGAGCGLVCLLVLFRWVAGSSCRVGWSTASCPADRRAYALVPAIGLMIAAPFFIGFVARRGGSSRCCCSRCPWHQLLLPVASRCAGQAEVRPNQRVMSGALLLLVMKSDRAGPGADLSRRGGATRSGPLAMPTHCNWHSTTPSSLLCRRDTCCSWLWPRRSVVPTHGGGPLMRIHAATLLLAATPRAAAAAAAVENRPSSTAPAGTVAGERIGDVDVFRGIPFAAPPRRTLALASARTAPARGRVRAPPPPVRSGLRPADPAPRQHLCRSAPADERRLPGPQHLVAAAAQD